MTSNCRNIWDTLRSADLSSTVANPFNCSTSSSVTPHLPDALVAMPFASIGYEGKHSTATSLSKSDSQERCTGWKYDHDYPGSLPKKRAITRDEWLRDSRKNCSPFLKADCLRRKQESDHNNKVQNFTFVNVDLPSSLLPVNISEVKSNSRSIKSSGNTSLHHRTSRVECHLSTRISPVYPVTVTFGLDCTNALQKSNENVSRTVVSRNSVHRNSIAETGASRLEAASAINRHHYPRARHDQRHSRDNCNPILSRAEFGDYLHLNEAGFVSVENCGTDSNTKRKVSVNCCVTSSTEANLFVADLTSRTTRSCYSKSVAEAKFDASCDMLFERDKSVIHDAVVPVLVPENSGSLIGVRCHSNDLDVEMENLSEAEDIPSFKCPFDIDELVSVDESDGPGIFLETDLSRDVLPTNRSETASVSTVSALHSAICDLTLPAMSSVSLSGHISPSQLISEMTEGCCSRSRGGNDKSDFFIQSDDDRLMYIDKNAYSELQQLYQSEQLSGDLLHVDKWCEIVREMDKSVTTISLSAACDDHVRPCDDGSNARAARIRRLNCKTDSELDNDGIQDAVMEALGILETDECSQTLPVSKTVQSVQQKTISNKQRKFKNQRNESGILKGLESEVALPESCKSVAMNNMTNLNISSPIVSAAPPPRDTLSKTSIGVLDPVSHLKGVILDSESFIPPTDVTKLVQKISLEDSVALKEMFNDEKKNAGYNLDLFLEPSPTEIFNRPMNIKNFSSPSPEFQFIPEFDSSVDNGRMSENAMSPCSVFPADECFLGTWSHPSEMHLCTPVHNESMDKSSSDLSQTAVAYFSESGLKTSLSELEGLSMSSASPLSAETNSNFAVLRGGTSFQTDSGDEKNFQDSYSESGHSELSENPNYMSIDGCSRRIRRPRLLAEIANSNGYIVERKRSQPSGGSLFVDSKMLTREERVLQMVHMQITKMEVKEELIKLKKSEGFSEIRNQSINKKKTIVTGKFNKPVSHQKVNRCIKVKSSSSCLNNGRRLKKRNLWSSRKFMQQPNFSSCYQTMKYSQCTNDKMVAKVRRKLKIANEVRKLRLRVSESNSMNLYDKRQKGGKDEQRNGNSAEMEALHVSVNGTNSFTASTVVFSNDASKEWKNTLNELDESFCLSAPFVPSQVKRVIVCHNTGETILHKAARLGYYDVALWCCQSGFVDVNACDNAGYTPLHESCLSSQFRISEYLIHYGADVNYASGIDGRRPIHEAVESGCLETIRLLLSAGADISLTTYSGHSVLEISKSREMKEFLKAYLSELNGLNDEDDAETEWQFIPSWSDDPASSGVDLLCDVPPCDPKCDEFYVELSLQKAFNRL